MLLTALTYHLNSRKMSAIDESATTYCRRNPCQPQRDGSCDGYGSMGRAEFRFGKRKAEMHVELRGRFHELGPGSLCAARRDIEGHAAAIPPGS